MFGQTFALHDLIVVGLLIVLEGVLSIDNALVLGILARRLPHHLQSKALTYGLVGAFVFRCIAIGTAAYLLHWHIVKLLGGGYLIYISIKHFFFEGSAGEKTSLGTDEHGAPRLVDDKTGKPLSASDESKVEQEKAGVFAQLGPHHGRSFWSTVFVIEMTDIAFAVDSIVAAIGVVGPPPDESARHPKLWVVITGGMLGVVLMRFAAVLFIRLLEKFPRFETAAYLLVIVIGAKLVADWCFTKFEGHGLDFHNPSHPEFWIFWVLMVLAFLVGFIPHRHDDEKTDPTSETAR